LPAIVCAFFLGIIFYCLSYQHISVVIFIAVLSLTCYQFNFFNRWIAFLSGIFWMAIYVGWQTLWVLPAELEGTPLIVTGYIVSIPEKKLSHTHFVFDLERIENQSINRIHSGLIRCAWQNAPHLGVGEKWQLCVKLKKTHSPLNPGGFDYEAWLFSHGIRAIGTVKSHQANFKLSQPLLSHSIDRLRQNLAEKTDAILLKSESKGLIKALLVGDQSSILEDQWKVLRQTGTNHLFAIAGLHIGFASQMVYLLLNFYSRFSPRVMLSLSAPLLSASGALITAVIYSALAGFSLPTKRAVIMLSVFLIAKIRRRNVSAWHSWSVAFGILLIVNPLQILTESFWLSFTAVGSLIYGFQGRIELQKKPWSKIFHSLKTQWITSVALIPLTILLFQQASLIGFFANFIAIPWIGFVVAPLTLLCGLLMLIIPVLGNRMLAIPDFLLTHFWPILKAIGDFPNSQWYQVIFTPWTLISGIIAILLLLAPKGFPCRWLMSIWILPLVFCMQKKPVFGELNFTLLDVGQGLATVVRTNTHVLVFDTGAHYKNFFDAGESILVPFLRFFHIHKIDVLMISHGDNDHIGGSETLLRTLPVDRIITSVPERFTSQQNLTLKIHPAVFSCHVGQTWWWDGVKFEVLYPPVAGYFKGNNGSCVLKISTATQSLLLTGDIEKEAENTLLSTYFDQLASDVLVVPHHGSKTSSTEAFINAIRPKVALFSVGYRNQYHLPAPIIVSRYQEKRIEVYDTVHCGAIEINLGFSSVLPVHCYRVEHAQFWRE
jgi:competence protein ComEC